MQRLVTIYFDNQAYTGDNWIKAGNADKHGSVEEHLAAELAAGWRVVSLTGFGGASHRICVRGWLGVVLEKD